MANFLKKMIENDKKELRRLEKIADKIDAHASAMEQLSDEQLREKTDEFKARYQKGNLRRTITRSVCGCP